MKTFFKTFWIFLFALGPLFLRAQDFSFTASVSKNTIFSDEVIKLTLVLTNTTGKITLPAMADWKVVSGASTSNNMSIYNGKMTSSYTESYSIRPNREGTLVIPEITARTDKGTLATKPVTVQVNKGKAPANPQNQSQSTSPGSGGTGDFYVEVELSKAKVYQGEPVLATYRFYSTTNPQQIEKVDYPKMDGFWTEDIETEPRVETTVINGRQYYTAVVKRQLLFPQVSGTLQIDGFSMSLIVSSGQGFFFRQNYRVQDKASSSKLEVLALPVGKPDPFIGSYSPLSLRVELQPSTFKANEAINLTLVFTGKGNMKLIEQPELAFPPDFEVFEPKTKDNISISAGGESGSRSFEFVLIPRTAGEYVIPGQVFGYFNYETKSYENVSIPEQRFQVEPGSGQASGNYTYDNKSDVQVLSQDIRYIKPNYPGLFPRHNPFFGSLLYYALLAIPLLALPLFAFMSRRRYAEEQDSTGTAMRRAGKVARKHLTIATAALQKGDRSQFRAEIFRALQQYLSAKFAIPQADLNSERIRTEFMKRLPASSADELMHVVHSAEMIQFSGMATGSEEGLLEQTRQLIERLEK